MPLFLEVTPQKGRFETAPFAHQEYLNFMRRYDCALSRYGKALGLSHKQPAKIASKRTDDNAGRLQKDCIFMKIRRNSTNFVGG